MKKVVFKKMKRTISFILIIAIIASSGILSSCTRERKNPIALTINGVEIANDVFTINSSISRFYRNRMQV